MLDAVQRWVLAVLASELKLLRLCAAPLPPQAALLTASALRGAPVGVGTKGVAFAPRRREGFDLPAARRTKGNDKKEKQALACFFHAQSRKTGSRS